MRCTSSAVLRCIRFQADSRHRPNSTRVASIYIPNSPEHCCGSGWGYMRFDLCGTDGTREFNPEDGLPVPFRLHDDTNKTHPSPPDLKSGFHIRPESRVSGRGIECRFACRDPRTRRARPVPLRSARKVELIIPVEHSERSRESIEFGGHERTLLSHCPPISSI